MFEQSANFPGRVVEPNPDFFLTSSLAFFAAILALAASAAFAGGFAVVGIGGTPAAHYLP